MTSPDFRHPVPCQPYAGASFRIYSMLAYGGEREPMEFNYNASTPRGAIDRCRFEASYKKRPMVKVRAPDGAIIYDGDAEAVA